MSNSGDWGPTPAGVDLAENQNKEIVGSVVGIMVLGLASVALRMVTRLMKTGPGLAADDFVILFAAVRNTRTKSLYFYLPKNQKKDEGKQVSLVQPCSKSPPNSHVKCCARL